MDVETKQQFWDDAQDNLKAWIQDDPIGLPDKGDFENIQTIMRNYEKKHPGEIAYLAKATEAKKEAAFNDFSSVKDKNMNMRHVFSMPIELLKTIELSYPLMFANKKHMAWFRKNFPMFSASRKY